MEQLNHTCSRCSKSFPSTQAFLTHISRNYHLSSEQIYREIHGITATPVCKCGCGAEVSFHTFTDGYVLYKRGHASEGLSLRKDGVKERSEQTYRDNLASGKTVRKKRDKPPVDSTKEFKCPTCPESYDKLISLSIHFRKGHKKTAKDLVVALLYGGQEPTCRCGCGEKVKFLDITRGFSDYAWGHQSRVSNNYCTKEIQGKSQATKREMWKNGELVAWQKGLTKETDIRIALYGKQSSATILGNKEELYNRSERMKKAHEDGLIVQKTGSDHHWWNGGCSPLTTICHANPRLYSEWKYPKLLASGFACTRCEMSSAKGGHLHVHHNKETMASIIHKIAGDCGWGERHFALRETSDEETQGLKHKISETVAEYHIQNKVDGVVLCESCHKQEHARLNF